MTILSNLIIFETMMKIQTIIVAIAFLSVLASAIPVSGNGDFPTSPAASEATNDHPTERPESNDPSVLRNATRTPGGGNDPPQMLRKGGRRSLPIVSKAHHPDETYPLVRHQFTVALFYLLCDR
jgi:hypothetical protein